VAGTSFWEFPNNQRLGFLVYSLVFKSAWLASEEVPFKRTQPAKDDLPKVKKLVNPDVVDVYTS